MIRQLAAAAALALTLSACGGGSTDDAQDGATDSATEPASAAEPSPLADAELYVNPEGHAVQQAAAWRKQNRDDLVGLLAPMAEQPVATWFTGDQGDPYLEARALTRAAAREGRVPVLVAYNLPNRDCGQYSSGGAADIDAYLSWLGSLAAGIEDREAIVVLEPDAIAHAIEGCAGADGDPYPLLAEAVGILKRQPNVSVYVDAGNASWIDDVDALAEALRASGVDEADGFALNVSNFETTETSAAYGEQLSERLDGARYVIDTSRNGAGPPAGSGTGDHSSWCNPDEARLGEPPHTEPASIDPALDKVDALLWVKQPGDSDGECGAGQPPAGTFDLELAGGLLGQPL